MKKAVLTISGMLGVLAGGLLIWKMVLPFIGMVFQGMWSCVASLLYIR